MSTDEIMNQGEAAKYISEHYRKMDVAELSHLTKFNEGPDFKSWGNQKVFHIDDLNDWIELKKKEGTEGKNTDQ